MSDPAPGTITSELLKKIMESNPAGISPFEGSHIFPGKIIMHNGSEIVWGGPGGVGTFHGGAGSGGHAVSPGGPGMPSGGYVSAGRMGHAGDPGPAGTTITTTHSPGDWIRKRIIDENGVEYEQVTPALPAAPVQTSSIPMPSKDKPIAESEESGSW